MLTRFVWVRSLLRRIWFPHVDQVHEADCGPAALLAVLRYWGGDTSLSEVRRMAGTRSDGTSLAGLTLAARRLGLEARGAVGTYDAMRREATPCIAHLTLPDGLHHFVVVRRAGSRRVIVGDPARRIRTLSRTRFEELWSSRALLLLKGGSRDGIRRRPVQPWYAWIADYGAREPGWLPQSLFLGAVSAGTALFTALYIQTLIDRLIPSGDMPLILVASGLLLLLLAGGAAIDFLRARFLIRLGRAASSRTTADLLGGLLGPDSGHLGPATSGDLGSRLREGIPLHRGMVEAVSVVLIEGFTLTGSAGLLFFTAPVLALTALAVLPLHGLMVVLRVGRIRHGHDRTLAALGAAEAELSDGLLGAEEIRILGATGPYAHRVRRAFDRMLGRLQGLEDTKAGLGLVSAVSSGLLLVPALCIGAAQVVEGTLLLGQLVAAYSLLTGAVGSVNRALGGFLRLQEVRVAANRARVLLPPPSSTDASSPIGRIRTGLRLEFSNGAVLQTAGGPTGALDFPTGTMTGVLGATGVGKTTLLRMLAGDLPDFAELRADDRSIDGASVESYRARIGFVPRDPHIFRDTIRFNVLLGRRHIRDAGALAWLESEGMASFIAGLPLGWSTPIGEGHRTLSAGERQIVGLLRALASRPDVLLVDEGLAGVDVGTRTRLLKGLRRLLRSGVLVVASHTNDVSAAADRVLHLKRIRTSNRMASARGGPV